MDQVIRENFMFENLNESEMLSIDGGGLLNEVCKDLTAFFVGASIGGKVGGAIGGSVGGPVGAVVGVVAGSVVVYLWEAAFE